MDKFLRFVSALGLILMCGMFLPAAHAQEQVVLASPDGQTELTVSISGEGRISYAVNRRGAALIAPSHIGFRFADLDPMARGFQMQDVERTTRDEVWQLPWGERHDVRDRHNEMAIRFTTMLGGNAKQVALSPYGLTIRFRLFDNGFAFRSEFDARPDGKAWQIAEEDSEFRLAQNGTAWWIPAGDWNRYEYLYSETAIDAVSSAHTPMTVRLADGTHMAFHEAALVDYAGMWLKRIDGLTFRSSLSPAPGNAKVVREGAFHTPWRSIRIADDAAGLYDNDLELNLNEPNKLGDVSWVEPFKYAGVWWEMHLEQKSWSSGPIHGATNENVKRHIDFAARHGLRGVLVEGWNKGWDGNWFGNGREYSFTESYPDFDLEMLGKYAAEKGVHLVGHHETGGNIAVYEAQLEDAMALYAKNGVDAVKTGYVADAGGIISANADGGQKMLWHDGQEMARHHLKVVETAARYKIAVNPHEPIKDTGLRRTYPNWVSREGARGMEYQAWGVPANIPGHVPTLIFTRMLSGPMDYTPGIVSLKGRGGRDLPSTLARQLALYLVLYSPIQMVPDLPENYDQYPDAMSFIEQVPVDWNDSRMLSGEVGRHAVIARQDKGSNDWYVGGVTNEEGMEAVVDLSFLPAGKRFDYVLWRDGDDADYRLPSRHSMKVEKGSIDSKGKLTVPMAPGGGFALRLIAR